MKNLKINNKFKSKIAAIAFVGVLSTGALTLTSCNAQIIDMNYEFNAAISVRDGVATIYEVKSWRDYDDGEQLQLVLKDGTVVLTSAFDTKLFNTKSSDYTIEDIARSLVGEDGEVIYFGQPNVKSK